MTQKTFKKSNAYFAISLVLLLSLAFLLQASHLMWGEWSFDQGYYILVARLMDYGYQPYTEIYMSEPPLMVWSIGLPYAVFGTVEAMQLVMVAYALIAIAAMVSIGSQLDGKLTGLLSGTLLAFNYSFFFSSRKVGPEIPSMSLALVAIALALRYYASGRHRWLLFSGAAMAGSLLIKLFMPLAIPLILLIIALPPRQALNGDAWQEIRRQPKRLGLAWLLWGGALLLLVVFSWFAFDVPMLLDQTILFHLNKSGGVERDLMGNIQQIWKVLSQKPILSLFALFGFGIALIRFKHKGWAAIAWLMLTIAFLLYLSPLRSKHLIASQPVLALLAAFALNFLLTVARGKSGLSGGLRWGAVVAGSVLSIALIVELVSPYKNLSKPRKPMVGEDMQPLVEALQKFTSPADCLITDNPYLALVSERMPPPWLSGVSYARFQSGSLDTQDMIDLTEARNCQVMAPTLDRIKNANRPYYDWAKQNYLWVWLVDGHEIMLGKPLRHAEPAIPVKANFSGQVELLGADWHPGDDAGHLSLYWRALQPFEQNYKIFVQLRNGEGQVVADADHEAYDGLIPTERWPLNKIFKDTIRVNLPPNLPLDSYAFYIGFYDPATIERLPVNGDASGENAVIIGQVEIRE